MADRLAIAARLHDIARLLAAAGGAPFRARAYERGARALESFGGDLAERIRAGRLEELPGIGPGLAAAIGEIHRTGSSSLERRLRAELPPGVLELIDLPGLGLTRIRRLHERLGVAGRADLERVLRDGSLRAVPGFGPETARRLLAALAGGERRPAELLLHHALAAGRDLLSHLRTCPGVIRAALAGALRRRTETVAALELAAASRRGSEVAEHFLRWPRIAAVETRSARRVLARLADGVPAGLTIAGPGSWGSALLRATGSAEHVAALERRAGRRGQRIDGRAREREIYRTLELPYHPPELRESRHGLEESPDAFADLIRKRHVRGAVHCHTTWSDGRASVLEMARAAERLGLEYITITDHSPTASYAGGLERDRLERQWEDIERAQEQVAIRILRGTESDILRDGSLDYPDAVLRRLDVVIASIHNRYGMGEEEMTRRVLRGLRHPLFKVWGHALGRYLLRRPPIPCRVEEVLDAVAEARAAIEVNGDPHRLDLAPEWLVQARRRGIPFVLSTDAHSPGELDHLRYAVAMARRAGIRREEVLNARGAEDFRERVAPAAARRTREA